MGSFCTLVIPSVRGQRRQYQNTQCQSVGRNGCCQETHSHFLAKTSTFQTRCECFFQLQARPLLQDRPVSTSSSLGQVFAHDASALLPNLLSLSPYPLRPQRNLMMLIPTINPNLQLVQMHMLPLRSSETLNQSTCIDITHPLIHCIYRRAKAERESRKKALQARAKKGVCWFLLRIRLDTYFRLVTL